MSIHTPIHLTCIRFFLLNLKVNFIEQDWFNCGQRCELKRTKTLPKTVAEIFFYKDILKCVDLNVYFTFNV